MRKVLFIFLLSVFIFGALGISSAMDKGIEVVDMVGRHVIVPVKVSRICPLKWGSTRILVYLNASKKIVGISEFEKNRGMKVLPYLIAHPEFKNLPIVQTGFSPNVEKIIELRPDLIIASYYTAGEADKLQERTGIPVVVIKPGLGAKEYVDYSDDSNTFYRSLRLVAKILHKDSRAEEIIGYVKSIVKDLSRRTGGISEREKPRVYIGGLSRHGSFGITSTQTRYPPFVLVNAKNVASGISSRSNTIQISRERLIAWDPDVMFIDEVNLKLVLKDLERLEYRQIKAVRNGKLYGVFPYPRYGLNHEIVLANAYYIGKVLYPDRFKDINPEKKADEIFSFFIGKPCYRTLAEKLGGYRRLTLLKK